MKKTLWQIDNAIYELIDEETGEITDLDALEHLEMEMDEKVRNCIALYKDCEARAEALKKAKLDLQKRQKAYENTMASLLKILDRHQQGVKFECTEGAISYRKSTVCTEIDEQAFLEWDGKWEYGESEFKPSVNDIKAAIKEGKKIPGWINEDKNNISIK